MNLKALVLGAAVLALSAPLAANAAGGAPVTITQSTVQDEVVGTSRNEPGQVMLTFVNHRATPATRVSFALVANGVRLDSLRATGTFAQGVAINESFATHAPIRGQHVIISSVTFADGSHWQNPDVPRGTFKLPTNSSSSSSERAGRIGAARSRALAYRVVKEACRTSPNAIKRKPAS